MGRDTARGRSVTLHTSPSRKARGGVPTDKPPWRGGDSAHGQTTVHTQHATPSAKTVHAHKAGTPRPPARNGSREHVNEGLKAVSGLARRRGLTTSPHTHTRTEPATPLATAPVELGTHAGTHRTGRGEKPKDPAPPGYALDGSPSGSHVQKEVGKA